MVRDQPVKKGQIVTTQGVLIVNEAQPVTNGHLSYKDTFPSQKELPDIDMFNKQYMFIMASECCIQFAKSFYLKGGPDSSTKYFESIGKQLHANEVQNFIEKPLSVEMKNCLNIFSPKYKM